MSTGTAPYCYRHPDRETYISCQRCARPICPDCMKQAAVGFQCPSCVHEGARSTRVPRTALGGRHSDNPVLTSQVLILINVAVWLLITVTGGRGSVWLDRFALWPNGGPTQDQFGRTVLLPEGVNDGAWWQLVTSMFTHVDLMHIGFNMLALWFLGPQLEAAVGRLRFLVLYLLSGLTGSAFVYLLTYQYTPTVGASGAIFGLMGGLLVAAVRLRANYSPLLFWLGLNVLITVVGRGMISWQGHLGGLVGGVLIALVLAYSPRSGRTVWQAVGIGLIALAVLMAIVARTAVLV